MDEYIEKHLTDVLMATIEVEGYFKDKTFTKSPLFLFPVEVSKNGDIWTLRNKVDDPVILNKVFLIGYSKFNEEKLADIDTEFFDLYPQK